MKQLHIVCRGRRKLVCVTADLDIFQDVGAGQSEASNIFGLPQVAIQAIIKVHHVVLCGIDLSEGSAQGAASPLELCLSATPQLQQLRLLLLQQRVSTQLVIVGTLVCILRPQ